MHCRLRLHEPSEKYVTLESAQEKNNTVGITVSGSLKSALATRSTDKDAYFAIRLIVSVLSGDDNLWSVKAVHLTLQSMRQSVNGGGFSIK